MELGQDGLGELLAELDSPLVEAVDIPDDALDEDLVLVQGNEPAQRVRRELLEEERAGGPVPVERPVSHQTLPVGHPSAAELGPDLVGRLALHQGFGLGEEVGQQDVVVPADRVVAADRSDEVARDEPGSLVEELIEGMLAIRPRLAPDSPDPWCSRGFARRSGRCPCRCSPCHPAGSMRQSGASTDRTAGWRGTQRRGSLLYQMPSSAMITGMFSEKGAVRKCSSVLVSSREKLLETVEADRAGDGESDGGPQRVAPPDPVPELEHIVRIDPELGTPSGRSWRARRSAAPRRPDPLARRAATGAPRSRW